MWTAQEVTWEEDRQMGWNAAGMVEEIKNKCQKTDQYKFFHLESLTTKVSMDINGVCDKFIFSQVF